MDRKAPQYLPVIERRDFTLLRRLMDAKFQNTYRSWADWVAQHAAWADADAFGQPMPVAVNITDFAAAKHLKAPPALEDLLRFTEMAGQFSAP